MVQYLIQICRSVEGMRGTSERHVGMGNKNPIRSANPIRSDRDPFESDWPIHGVVRSRSDCNPIGSDRF